MSVYAASFLGSEQGLAAALATGTGAAGHIGLSPLQKVSTQISSARRPEFAVTVCELAVLITTGGHIVGPTIGDNFTHLPTVSATVTGALAISYFRSSYASSPAQEFPRRFFLVPDEGRPPRRDKSAGQ